MDRQALCAVSQCSLGMDGQEASGPQELNLGADPLARREGLVPPAHLPNDAERAPRGSFWHPSPFSADLGEAACSAALRLPLAQPSGQPADGLRPFTCKAP